MKKTTIVVVLAACAVLIAAAYSVKYYVYNYVLPQFSYAEDYKEKYDYNNYSFYSRTVGKFRDWGLDFDMPVTGGEKVPVTLERDFYLTEYPHENLRITLEQNSKVYASAGETVELDFVTYSIMSGSSSSVYVRTAIDYNGRTYEGVCKMSQLATVYASYIEQNGLQIAFENATGERFSKDAVERCLYWFDRQLFDMGIKPSLAYPVNYIYIDKLLLTLSICLVIFALFVMALIVIIRRRRAYAAEMKAWNAESAQRWEERAADLPRFDSLKRTGQDSVRAPIKKERTFKDAFNDLFKAKR